MPTRFVGFSGTSVSIAARRSVQASKKLILTRELGLRLDITSSVLRLNIDDIADRQDKARL